MNQENLDELDALYGSNSGNSSGPKALASRLLIPCDLGVALKTQATRLIQRRLLIVAFLLFLSPRLFVDESVRLNYELCQFVESVEYHHWNQNVNDENDENNRVSECQN